MRTGAIFARGSCRALKWMALLGVVFALGAGSAAAQAKPNKPVLTVEGRSADGVTLKWTVPPGGPAITGFRTQAGTPPFTDDTPEPVPAPGADPLGAEIRTYDLDGATAGTRRSYRVGAIGAGGPTWSDVKHFTTEAPPVAITDLAVTTGDQMATLTWGRVTGARYYEYNFKLGDDSDDFTAAADARNWKRAGGSGTSRVVISGLMNGRSYVFGVQAVNNGGSTIAAPLVDGTPSGKPGAPTDLTAEVGTPDTAGKVTVTLDWTAPDDGGNSIKDYEYEIVDFRGWRLTGSANDYFDITGLDEDMAAGYTYRVRAVNDNGVGPAASTDGSTEGGGPTTTPAGGTAGRIKKIYIGSAVPKTIDGVPWMVVTEGAASNTVSVTVEWTADQLRDIWAAVPEGGKPADVTVMLDMMPAPVSNLAWVSPAENEAGHDDVTIGAGLMVKIPAKPADGDRRPVESEPSSTSIAFNRDADAENEAFYIEVTNAEAFEAASKKMSELYVINDRDPQGIELERVTKGVIYEGGPNQVYKVVANPRRVDLDLNVRFDLERVPGETVASEDNTIDKAIGTIPVGGNGQETVTLTLDDNDRNRVDDMLQLFAEVVVYALDSGNYDDDIRRKHVDIDVLDVHKIPPFKVDPTPETVTEGDNITLTYTIDRNPPDTIVLDPETLQYTSEALTLTVMAMDGSSMNDDFRIVAPKVTIEEQRGGGTQTADVEVEIKLDDDLGEEMLVLEATLAAADTMYGPSDPSDPYSSDPVSAQRLKEATTATITIKDATVKQIQPKGETEVKQAVDDAKAEGGGDEGLNPGESFSVMVSDLFTETTGYTGDYDVSATGSAVKTSISSNGDVMVEAVEVGMSTVTVTAKASMSMSSLVATRQTSADSAEVDFDVDVVNKKLMVTVAADPMTVEEGGTSMITASVEGRAVHADDGTVKIDLTVDGDATLSADSITIAAGDMMGSVTLTATDDDDYDDETVTVTYSGSGIDGQQQLMISVTDPDEATPTVRAKTDAAEKIAAAIAKAAGGAEWMVGGMVAEVEMDGLFDLDEGVTATYQGTSSDADVVKAMTTGNTLMLTPMGAGMATITVTGADNAGGSEAAVVTHDATVILANLTMTVTVEPMTVEEGGMATITAKASRMIAMGDGMVKVNLSVVGDATLSAEMIEIKADSDTGTATLTSTDDEMHEPDGETVTLIASGAGIDGNMSFDIMVTDNDAAPMDVTFTLSGPEDMNLPEGKSATLTATASAAVEEDTEIMIMRDGTSTAGADDYTAESIMIMAGEATGTTMVMAVEDNEPDSGSGSPEMLTLYGMVGNMQTNSVS
ncbi:MAG: fibronectin type III domain-containing protein, partial [Gemmatimonadetes bacterium]|nr:fibronectin type III domain-containing protein [Gemmatimonadota bacterium]